MHGPHRLGHAGHAVENGENPLGAGPRPLHGRHHAAHRIHPAVEAADVLHETDQNAYGKPFVLNHLPRAESPHHQQSQRGQQADDRLEKSPDGIHAIIGPQHAIVRRAKALDLPLLLGKGLDDPNAGNRVGQHAGHLAPCPHAQGKTATQPVAHPMHQVRNHRQRKESHQRQHGIERNQKRRHKQDRQHVIGEIEHVDRQEVADPVGIGADPCDQVARPLAAKELQRQSLHVAIGLVAHVDGDSLADASQHKGPSPSQQPGQDRRPRKSQQIPPRLMESDGFMALGRLQHVVDQRYGKVGGHETGAGAGHHQPEAQQDHPLARLGKTDQPVQGTDRRLVLDRSAIRAASSGRPPESPRNSDKPWSAARPASSPPANSPLRRRSNRSASRCACGARPIVYRHWQSRLSAPSSSRAPTPACSFARKPAIAASGQQRNGKAADAPRAGSLRQLRRAHVDQPPVGQDQQSAGVVQTGVQVEFEPNQRRLARRQLGLGHAAQIGRKLFPCVVGGVQVMPRRE